MEKLCRQTTRSSGMVFLMFYFYLTSSYQFLKKYFISYVELFYLHVVWVPCTCLVPTMAKKAEKDVRFSGTVAALRGATIWVLGIEPSHLQLCYQL